MIGQRIQAIAEDRALAEGVIDRAQASRWCPQIAESIRVLPAVVRDKQCLSPRAVYSLPQKQRNLILREAATALADMYRPGSDALVEDIWE